MKSSRTNAFLSRMKREALLAVHNTTLHSHCGIYKWQNRVGVTGFVPVLENLESHGI